MIASLIPLWLFAYVPTLDGPIHLNITQILSDWGNPHYPRLHQLFQLNIKPEPNWSVYLLLGLLIKAFSLSTSERIVLSLYALALPLAFVAFARLTNATSRYWLSAVLGYLVIYNATFFFGFYNFSLSLALFVLSSGLYLRYVERGSLGLGLGVAAASIGLFFTHVLGWAIFALVGVVFVLWRAFLMIRSGDRRHALAAMLLRCLAPVLPTLILMLAFMGRNTGGVLDYGNSDTGFIHRIVWLLGGAVLYGNSLSECAFLALGFLVATVYGASVARKIWRTRPLEMRDALVPAFFVVLAAALAIPNMLFGGGFVAIRIQIFVYMLPLLWLCANARWTERARPYFALIALSAASLLTVETVQIGRMSQQFEHVVKAEDAIEPQSTVLPLVLYPNGLDEHGRRISRGVPFLLHADNRIEIDRDSYCLRLSQASTLNFPLRYTASATPYEHLPVVHSLLGSEIDDPKVWDGLPTQMAAYESISGQKVDYLLVIGTQSEKASAIIQRLENGLRGRYAELRRSQQLPGFVLLHRLSGR
jgi:hypothetical protein